MEKITGPSPGKYVWGSSKKNKNMGGGSANFSLPPPHDLKWNLGVGLSLAGNILFEGSIL